MNDCNITRLSQPSAVKCDICGLDFLSSQKEVRKAARGEEWKHIKKRHTHTPGGFHTCYSDSLHQHWAKGHKVSWQVLHPQVFFSPVKSASFIHDWIHAVDQRSSALIEKTLHKTSSDLWRMSECYWLTESKSGEKTKTNNSSRNFDFPAPLLSA